MGLWGRFILNKVDCLIMLGVIGVQFTLFRGELPFTYRPGTWLAELFQHVGHLWMISILGATLYWLVVDYHPALEELRKSKIVMSGDGSRPDFGTRCVRSLVKAFTVCSASLLLLVGVFSDRRRFVHDRLSGTERVALDGVA